MTIVAPNKSRGFADRLATEFVDNGFGPLYEALRQDAGLVTVVRADNAVGLATGAWLPGQHPIVLMQNSGLGQSVNTPLRGSDPTGSACAR